jgi:hypothetical protein
MARTLDNAGMIRALKKWIGKRSQAEAAKELDVTPQYLSDVLNGRRGLGEMIPGKIGYLARTVYLLAPKRAKAAA